MESHQINSIAVLIPCYNEQATIEKVVRDFRIQLPQADIYVFDNNSTDNSRALAEAAGAIVIKEKRQGKGFVVAAMLRKVRADYYIMVDADDTYPAEYCRALLQPLYDDQADMVVGQRLSEYDQHAFRFLHLFGNKAICRLINSIFHSDLQDPLSGYRAFTSEVALQLPVVASGFDVETELTLQMLYRQFVIQEISVPYRARPSESPSKLNTFKDGFRVLMKIFLILRSYKPLTFFGTSGIICEITAFIIVLFLLPVRQAQTGNAPVLLFTLSSSLFMIGILLAAMGVFLNSLNFRLLEDTSVLSKQIQNNKFVNK
jgi:glycosyltransferase involved in cell wall biosynthesis